MINGIISLRNLYNEVHRDTVFEWEDEIARLSNFKIMETEHGLADYKGLNILKRIKKKVSSRSVIQPFYKKQDIQIAFILGVYEINFFRSNNCIPIFIDIWDDGYKYLYRIMPSEYPFFVTSFDVYNKFKNEDKEFNVHYVPLILSDKWMLKSMPEKTVDVVQVGRKNELLHSYMLEYIKKNPSIEYIHSTFDEKSGYLSYRSTADENKILYLNNRQQYMDFLKKAKVSIFSSPGIDGSRAEANGIDYPTPRFYEIASQYCFMVGRHTDHQEFRDLRIDDVFINVNDYNHFENSMNDIFNEKKKIDIKKYQEFMKAHCVSTWLKDLENIIYKKILQ